MLSTLLFCVVNGCYGNDLLKGSRPQLQFFELLVTLDMTSWKSQEPLSTSLCCWLLPWEWPSVQTLPTFGHCWYCFLTSFHFCFLNKIELHEWFLYNYFLIFSLNARLWVWFRNMWEKLVSVSKTDVLRSFKGSIIWNIEYKEGCYKLTWIFELYKSTRLFLV